MTDKITVKGTAPKFDQQELERRQEGFRNVYKQTDQCTALVRGAIPYEWLTNVIEMASQGYTLTYRYPISTQGGYHCRMIKPEYVQVQDLEGLDAQVKQDYVDELERERQEFRELLTAQLLQAAELKEQKKLEDKQAKLLAEVQKEVNDLFGELIVPN
jgi:hypothetical protein